MGPETAQIGNRKLIDSPSGLCHPPVKGGSANAGIVLTILRRYRRL